MKPKKLFKGLFEEGVRGWLVGGKSHVEEQVSLSSQAVEPMGCRFGLCDLHRTASSVILSPDHHLAAVVDCLGRVILIDCHKGVTLRMLKGHRDAQCAFIQVRDNEKKSRHHANTPFATFLIVYSPKKGVLEFFSTQQVLKVASFSASKHSCLLYSNYGLVSLPTSSKSNYICQCTCVLVDPDGQVKEITIPFHFALSEKNSKRARDVHIYRRLKHSIKTCNSIILHQEVLTFCSELKTSEVKLQCLEALSVHKGIDPEIIFKTATLFVEQLCDINEEELNGFSKQLNTLSQNLISLSSLFMFFNKDNCDTRNTSDDSNTKFYLGQKELNNLQKLFDLSTSNGYQKFAQLKVTFHEDEKYDFSSFLSVYNLSSFEKIDLKSNVDSSTIFLVGKQMFEEYILGQRKDYEDLKSEVLKSNIDTKQLLMQVVIPYWINRGSKIGNDLENEMISLSKLLYTFTKTESPEIVTVEYNRTSPFWTQIRMILDDSLCAFSALTAALTCRGIAQKIENEQDMEITEGSFEDESMEIWEKLSQEKCDWMLLIGKLEDVSLLSIVLSKKPVVSNEEFCELPKLKCEPIDISLKYILEKGRGIVSELVARWLTIAGINPDCLIYNDLTHQVSAPDSDPKMANTNPPSKAPPEKDELLQQPVLEHLNILRKQFPHSLEVSILLANMAWEYAHAWQKQLHMFTYLEASLKCLNHIPNIHLRQGLYNLVWNTHLKIVFESTCKLLNKVGKLPKEKLCQQDTGLSDFEIVLFVDLCTELLDEFMNTVQNSYTSVKIPVHYENIWEDSGQPLADLAMQQNRVNFDLLHCHYQLSLVMQMLTKFGVKHSKPVNNLFDIQVIGLFFTDLQQKTQVNWYRSDTKTFTSQMQLLHKVVAASIETITINNCKVYSSDHVFWMSKCLSLARIWNLDTDILRRFQVTQLFANGFSELAEELLPSVNEVHKLGPELLAIAGRQFQQFMSSSAYLGECIAALSPQLTQYLDSKNGEWCSPSSLEAISNLITHCLRCLDEKQLEYKLAVQLLEACSTLSDIKR